MTMITDKNTLKGWFKRGLKPLEIQFYAWMDSYWHKSESIPTATIEGLEATLNSKAEALELSGHLSDFNNPHRVDKEAVGLGSVDDTADLEKPVSNEQRRAIDEAVREASDVVLTGIGEVRESTKKTFWVIISDESSVLIKEYIRKGKSLVGARLEVTCTDDGLSYTNTYMCTYALSKTNMYKLTFLYLGYGGVSGNLGIHRLEYYAPITKSGTIIFANSTAERYIETGNYVYDRYTPTDSFDMNDFIESGGISAQIDADIVGLNVPEGFTDFTGYVLNNEGHYTSKTVCCTQVVIDRILLKTMQRSSVPTEDNKGVVWTPWSEIGGNDVYIVTEYPTDLSEFPEGSIFIKE